MDSELTVTLSVRDGAAACDFYRDAFGAAELNRVTSPDGDVVGELAVGGALLRRGRGTRVRQRQPAPSHRVLGAHRPVRRRS